MNVLQVSNKICRTCLTCMTDTSNNFIDIFSTEVFCNNVATIIMECTPIQISLGDGYSTVICKTCFYKLETAYNFRQLCIISDKAIRNHSNVISEQVYPNEDTIDTTSDTKSNNCTNILPLCKTPISVYVITNRNLLTRKEYLSLYTFFSEDFNNRSNKLLEKKIESNISLYDCEDSEHKSDKSFKSIANINNDRYRYRLGRPKGEYVCSWCSRHCTDNSRLRIHERVHTGERPFVCNDCGARFANHGSLARHTRTHTGEKKFNCVECGARFAYKNSLTIHSRRHTGEKPYVCATCGKRFADNACLKQHRVVHTGERRFTCDHCGKRFAFKATLDIHVRTHTGEKPFLCAICSKTFRQRTHFQAHMRGHTGEKPFTCSICDKSFTDRSGLKRHQRSHLLT